MFIVVPSPDRMPCGHRAYSWRDGYSRRHWGCLACTADLATAYLCGDLSIRIVGEDLSDDHQYLMQLADPRP